MINLKVNGKAYEVDVDPSTPILWVIREKLGLTGTKFGCGAAQCGALRGRARGHRLQRLLAGVELLPGPRRRGAVGAGLAARQGAAG